MQLFQYPQSAIVLRKIDTLLRGRSNDSDGGKRRDLDFSIEQLPNIHGKLFGNVRLSRGVTEESFEQFGMEWLEFASKRGGDDPFQTEAYLFDRLRRYAVDVIDADFKRTEPRIVDGKECVPQLYYKCTGEQQFSPCL